MKRRSLYERIIPLGIPLAWLQLTSDRKRFAVASAGITFAVAMMLFQVGLRGALFRQVVGPLSMLDADVVIVSPNYEYFGVGRGFANVRLKQAFAVPEVVDANGIKLGCMPFKNVDDGRERDIFAIAFDPSKRIFEDESINSSQNILKREGTVLFDTLSRKQYGDVASKLEAGEFPRTELSGHRARIGAGVEIGATFAADGNVLMSLDTLSKIWRHDSPDISNVGLIRIREGADASVAADKLRKILPPDVRVMTKGEFIEAEKEYWAVRTPIGFVIGASMAVAIFVGAVIVYQILYTDVTDHIPEYATLKAIGFSDSFFVWIIVQESLILSLFGFIPGSLLAAVLYKLTRDVANMPTQMSLANLALIFFLAIFMCVSAGLLATRKLRKANPADIF